MLGAKLGPIRLWRLLEEFPHFCVKVDPETIFQRAPRFQQSLRCLLRLRSTRNSFSLGDDVKKMLPYSARCLVRLWIHTHASVTHFLREGGLRILSSTLVGFMLVWRLFFCRNAAFFGLRPSGRRVPGESPGWPTVVGCRGLGVAGTPGI